MRTRVGPLLAATLVAAALATPAHGHPPSSARRLLVESRPDGRWLAVHLVLSGVHRHTALELAAGPKLSEDDAPLVRALAPRALDGLRVRDAEGPIDLSKGEAAVRREPGQIELMILASIGTRGAEGLELRLEKTAEPIEVRIVGVEGVRVLRPGRSLELSPASGGAPDSKPR